MAVIEYYFRLSLLQQEDAAGNGMVTLGATLDTTGPYDWSSTLMERRTRR